MSSPSAKAMVSVSTSLIQAPALFVSTAAGAHCNGPQATASCQGTAMSPITADGGVVELTREEGRAMLDERTRRELGMTLEQFEAAVRPLTELVFDESILAKFPRCAWVLVSPRAASRPSGALTEHASDEVDAAAWTGIGARGRYEQQQT